MYLFYAALLHRVMQLSARPPFQQRSVRHSVPRRRLDSARGFGPDAMPGQAVPKRVATCVRLRHNCSAAAAAANKAAPRSTYPNSKPLPPVFVPRTGAGFRVCRETGCSCRRGRGCASDAVTFRALSLTFVAASAHPAI